MLLPSKFIIIGSNNWDIDPFSVFEFEICPLFNWFSLNVTSQRNIVTRSCFFKAPKSPGQIPVRPVVL